MMVLPAVGMNTDHVVGLGPAANCSCCNLSESLCLESAMGLVLAVIGTRLCWNCSLFAIISFYHHDVWCKDLELLWERVGYKRCFEVSIKILLFLCPRMNAPSSVKIELRVINERMKRFSMKNTCSPYRHCCHKMKTDAVSGAGMCPSVRWFT